MSKTEPAAEPNGATGPVVISVCITCGQQGESEDKPGARLLDAIRLALRDGDGGSIAVRPVQCLSVCSRPCTAAFTGPGRYSYVFGDLDPETAAPHLLTGARTYRDQQQGYMLWRERPEPLRRGIVARVPPLDWGPEDGRHPR